MSKCTLCGRIPPEGEPMMASTTIDESRRNLCMRCAQTDMFNNLLDFVSRIEVYDHHAEHLDKGMGAMAYGIWKDEPVGIELSLQDNGRTLKIFVQEKK